MLLNQVWKQKLDFFFKLNNSGQFGSFQASVNKVRTGKNGVTSSVSVTVCVWSGKCSSALHFFCEQGFIKEHMNSLMAFIIFVTHCGVFVPAERTPGQKGRVDH